MPIYEYECQSPKCGHHFEVFQKMSDAPAKTCPACKGKKVKKLISSSSFVLKGSGWYQTDIARKEKAKKEELSKPKKSAGESTPKAAESTPKKDTSPAGT